MGARAGRGRLPVPTRPLSSVDRPDSVARLVFLRGRDADGTLRELAAGRAALRPVLGALARV